jgi:SnoaL-like domain
MYSVEELSDRVEIQDRLAMYCHAFDRADWAALDGIFCPRRRSTSPVSGSPSSPPGPS